jgi:serine/threonine protein phosphatase 1
MTVIGDIHGHARDLEALLRRTGEEDLVFLGDYIDTGPDGRDVLAIVDDLVLRGRAVALLGNHEDMLLQAVGLPYPSGYDYEEDIWEIYNSGHATVSSYGFRSMGDFVPFMRDHILHGMATDMLRAPQLTLRRKVGDVDVLAVHAGFRPGTPFEEQDPMDLLWIREEFLEADAKDFPGWPLIVHGHTGWSYDPKYGPRKRPKHRVNVDGGIYRGGGILAYVVEERRLLSSKSRKR